MKLVDALYTYGYNDRKMKKVLQRIKENRKLSKRAQVIIYPLIHDGLFEIYSYRHLLSPCYKSLLKDVVVLGVASDRAGADELVVNIVQDVYDSDIDFDIKRFFGL